VIGKKKAKMGRPPLPPEERKSVYLSVRLTKAEHERLKALAKEQGVTVTELIMRQWREKES
jgi:predicted HicB family RNase H-like nuclease